MLACLLVAGCGAAGADSAWLSALLAAATFAFSAAVLAVTPIDRRARRAARPVAAAVLLLLGWTAIPALAGGGIWSPAFSIVPEAYAPGYLALLSRAALFFAALAIGLRRGMCRRVGGWIVAAGGLLLAGTIVARQTGMLERYGGVPGGGFQRFSGTIGNPNAAGCFYGMIALIAAGCAIDRAARAGDRAGRILAAGGAALVAACAIACVLLSQSRAAFVLTLLAALLLGMARLAASRADGAPAVRVWLGLAGAAVGLCVIVPPLAGDVLDRLAILDADGLGRVAVWRHYAAMAAQAPPFGYGLGSFFALNQRQLDADTALALWNFGAAHHAALQFALEAGWPAPALLIVAGVLTAMRVVPALIIHADSAALAMVAAIGVAIGCSTVDIALNVPGIATLATALAGLCWGRALRFRSAALA